jgi:tripartite ATP-independent transporter DctP family solute receptor
VKRHLVTLLLALAATSSVRAQTELRAWNIHPEAYPVTVALEGFAESIAKSTGGRYKVRVFSNAVLGDQPKAVQMLKQGEIDLAEFSLNPVAEAAPAAKVLTLPFLFRDSEHMFRLLDGKLGDQFEAKLEAAGYIVLGWYDGGARHLYCNRPVKQASDFQGLRIRVQQSEMAIEMTKLMGMTPVVVPYKEVLDAFKSGKIDCAENNLPSYESAGHMAVAKYVYLSNHTVSPEVLVISVPLWKKLSEADRKAFKEAGQQSAVKMRQLWKVKVDQARAAAAKQGSEFATMKDYGPLVTKMRPLHDKYFQDPVTRQELFTILSN